MTMLFAPSLALALLGALRFQPPIPPIANAGVEDLTECTSYFNTLVQLDGSASTGSIASYEWFEFYGTENVIPLGRGMRIQVPLTYGRHWITLKVTDNAGLFSIAHAQKLVHDSIAPVVRLTTTPAVLWPPDLRMVDVSVTPLVEESCSDVSVELRSVTSNEPDDGDIQDVAVGFDDRAMRLRAETGTVVGGRRYVLTYGVTDAAGLSGFASVTVAVQEAHKLTPPLEPYEDP